MCGIGYVRDLTARRNVVADALVLAENLRNRGQHGAGIAVAFEGFPHIIESGKLAIASIRSRIDTLMGNTAIVHTRYQTSGSGDCHTYNQPFFSGDRALIFNGNIANHHDVRNELLEKGIHCTTDLDTEVLLRQIEYLMNTHRCTIQQMLTALEQTLDGGFTFGIVADDGDAVFYRSKNGIRPLNYTSSQGKVIVASESHAIEQVDSYAVVKSLNPGEALFVVKNGIHAEKISDPERTACYKEWVYLADARSKIDSVSVLQARYEMGVQMAKREQITAKDSCLVCAVPRTAIPFARGFSDGTGAPMKDVIFKRSNDRTFIETPAERLAAIDAAYYFDPEKIRGATVYLCDDSIIRGPTMQQIVKKLREYGAVSVHVRIASAPVAAPCFYGISFPTTSELLLPQFTNECITDELPPNVELAIARHLQADSVKYVPVSMVKQVIDPTSQGLCMACVTGEYPTPAGQKLYQLQLQ
jgi:amidophosphoribosyltransferase